MRAGFTRWTALALFGLAELAAAAIALLALMPPANAQLDDRFPFMEERRRRYQQNYQQYQGSYGYQDQRQQPADSSRAPAPRRADVAPTTKVMVFGDSMSDWLAYGLEEAFADTPEIGILRKPRTNSGLIRIDTYDWPSTAREMLNAEKPDYVVMMIGLSDRRGIREAIRQAPARPPAGQKQPTQQSAPAAQPAASGQAGVQQQAAAPAAPAPQPAPAPAKPTDTEA